MHMSILVLCPLLSVLWKDNIMGKPGHRQVISASFSSSFGPFLDAQVHTHTFPSLTSSPAIEKPERLLGLNIKWKGMMDAWYDER